MTNKTFTKNHITYVTIILSLSVTDGEDEEGGNEAEDEASDFDVSFDDEQSDNEKCCGNNDEDDDNVDVSSNASDESSSSSDDLELECSDEEESDCESNCSELMRIQNHEKEESEKKLSSTLSEEHDDKDAANPVPNTDEFSSPASLTESRPELVAQIDQEIEIRDHYRAVSTRNKSASSDTVRSSQFRKSGPYENYIPPPSKYVDEKHRDGHSFYQKLSMTSSTSPKDISKTSYGKQYIKKEIPTDTNIAERKGGGKNRTSLRHWEQQDGSEPTTKNSTKNDEREDTDATDHVNGSSSSSLSLHAQGLSSIRKLLAAGQTSNV